jgi:hypothetical protein
MIDRARRSRSGATQLTGPDSRAPELDCGHGRCNDGHGSLDGAEPEGAGRAPAGPGAKVTDPDGYGLIEGADTPWVDPPSEHRRSGQTGTSRRRREVPLRPGRLSVAIVGTVVLALTALAGCLTPGSTTCVDGTVCPPNTQCDTANHRCVTGAEEMACAGHSGGDACTLSGAPGTCRGGACIPHFCGDGVRNDTESCDGTDLGGETCASLGFYGQTTGLACTPSCIFETSGCEGFCGDGMVNGQESCDGAPPEGKTCLDFGFDRGLLGCTALCGPDFSGCDSVGWKGDPSHTGQFLSSVWGSAANDVFAVGGGGAIVHWDGSSWSSAGSVTTNDLYGVWGASTTDVFAVGQAGTILHGDGSSWSPMKAATTNDFHAVWGSGPKDVYAVGLSTAEHWDGETWREIGEQETVDPLLSVAGGLGASLDQSLNGVWGSSSRDVYIVGDSLLAHWDGFSWTTLATGDPPSYTAGHLAVWGSGPNDVYVVGPNIDHWDGATWSEVASPVSDAGGSLPILAVWGSGPDNVFTLGDTKDALGAPALRIDRWNGDSWSQAGLIHYSGQLGREVDSVGFGTSGQPRAGLWGAWPDAIFAAGPSSTVFQNHGTAFMSQTLAGSVDVVVAISGDAAGDVFAVGLRADPNNTYRQDPVLMRWNQNTWEVVQVGTIDFVSAMWVGGPHEVITNVGGFSQWNGSAFLQMPPDPPPSIYVNDIWGSGPEDIYAVGESTPNLPMVHWDGTTWAPVTPDFSWQPGTTLSGVWGSSAGDVFAVGTQGIVMHFDGTKWSLMDKVSEADLSAVWGTAMDDVYAVGAGGTILHFDGSGWSVLAAGTTEDLLTVGGSGPGDVFAASSTTLFHARTGAWEHIQLPSDIEGMWVTPARIFLLGASDQVPAILTLDRYTVTCQSPERDCSDGWDNDCNGLVDAADPSCAGKVVEQCANLVDDNHNGLVDCADPECMNFPTCKNR